MLAISVCTQDEETLRKEARAQIDLPATSKLIRDRLLDFLTFNAYHLPMYARPGMW